MVVLGLTKGTSYLSTFLSYTQYRTFVLSKYKCLSLNYFY
nr:MAG TPA: hypothetical protein [Caudoviricetes sp.]